MSPSKGKKKGELINYSKLCLIQKFGQKMNEWKCNEVVATESPEDLLSTQKLTSPVMIKVFLTMALKLFSGADTLIMVSSEGT